MKNPELLVFAEEEERAKIHSHFAQPDYLDPDV